MRKAPDGALTQEARKICVHFFNVEMRKAPDGAILISFFVQFFHGKKNYLKDEIGKQHVMFRF